VQRAIWLKRETSTARLPLFFNLLKKVAVGAR